MRQWPNFFFPLPLGTVNNIFPENTTGEIWSAYITRSYKGEVNVTASKQATCFSNFKVRWQDLLVMRDNLFIPSHKHLITKLIPSHCPAGWRISSSVSMEKDNGFENILWVLLTDWMSRTPLAELAYANVQAKAASVSPRESTKLSWLVLKGASEDVVKNTGSRAGPPKPSSKLGCGTLGELFSYICLSFLASCKRRIRVPYLRAFLRGLNEVRHTKCLEQCVVNTQ